MNTTGTISFAVSGAGVRGSGTRQDNGSLNTLERA
jgi:hypothetical protein